MKSSGICLIRKIELNAYSLFCCLIYLSHFLISPCLSSIILPNKLQSISEVTIYNQKEEVNSLRFDEFVDSVQSKSSLEIHNNAKNSTLVVFNFPTTNRNSNYLAYSAEDNSCSLYKPADLLLDKTRKLAEMLLAENDTLDEAFIGPVAVLKSIETRLKEFRCCSYVLNNSSETLPKYVFQKVVKSHPDLESGKSLVVLVTLVTSHSKSIRQPGKYLDEMKDDLEYSSVTTCLLPSSSDQDYERNYFCNRDEVTMNIDYFLISDVVKGTDLGRLLEPKTESYDFDADPFTLPIGIGCWLSKNFRGRKMFQVKSHQFTAEYETLTENEGTSFIAYDNEKKLVRIDRKNRKNVYDLNKRISAHFNEIDSVMDLMILPETITEDCLVIEIQNDTRFSEDFSAVDLLGVGMNSEQSGFHLGTRVIDHIEYGLFETRVKADKIPLIINVDPSTLKPNLMYFITYYVEEFIYVTRVVVPASDDYVLIPKFMELWSYDPTNRKSTLLNMVTFSQFSWMLDAFPEKDADSLNPINIFSMPECLDNVAKRLDVSFLIKSDEVIEETLIADRAHIFRSSITQLVDQISNHISNYLDTSHLNIIGFKLGFKPKNSANIFVEARLSSLKLGYIKETVLAHMGYSDFVEMFRSDAMSIDTECYNIGDCRLKSVLSKGPNYAVYCRQQTTYAIIWREDLDFQNKKIHQGLPNDGSNDTVDDTLCFIYQLDWIHIDSEKEFKIEKLKTNFEKLSNSPIKLEISYRDSEKRLQYIRYSGQTTLPAFKVLDWSLSSEKKSQFEGIRYLVKEDLQHGNNYNLVLKVNESSDNHLMQCQVACQMDNYCQSFSLCLDGNKAGECVLSTLLINSRDIGVINGSSFVPILNPFDETYGFSHDTECNIHPKETLSSYLMDGVFMLPNDGSLKDCSTLPLQECAIRNDEKWSKSNQEPTNFVYCPMTSCCLLNQVYGPVNRTQAGQECQVYTRIFSEFFEMRSFARMILDLGKDEANRYIRVFAGVEDEECARLCKGRYSKCLAYDTCWVEDSIDNHPFCILHSVNSPLINYKINGNFSQNSSRLVGSSSCHHRAMKGIYATTRSLTDALSDSGSQLNHIKKVEVDIEDAANLKSQKCLKLMRQSSPARQAPKRTWNAKRRESKISTLILVIGIIFGAVGFLFGDLAVQRVKNFWTNVRLSHFNRRSSGIDLLNLPDN